MERRVNIVLLEKDRFFEAGMKYILREYFFQLGITPVFLAGNRFGVVDLLVVRQCWNGWVYPCRFLKRYHRVRGGFIVIRDSHLKRRGSYMPCIHDINSMHPKYKPESFVFLVGKVLSLEQSLYQDKIGVCAHCEPGLTQKERHVLNGLSMGFSPKRLAKLLGLSPKTISTHKRNAMKKIGFHRNNELYLWLRHGGLNY